MRYKTSTLLILFLLAFTAQAQETIIPFEPILLEEATPEQPAKPVKKQRNLRYNILGGPGYTPDYGIVLGGSALATFRMNPSDTTLLRSVVPLSLAIMFKGGVNVSSRPQLFFKNDRMRIFGEFRYKNTKDNFYGVGYSTNRDFKRGEEHSEYRYNQVKINPRVMFRMNEAGLFIGPQFDLNYDKFKKPAEDIVNDPSYIAAGGDAGGYSNFSSGLGFLVSYDTRDVPANAYRGIFLDAKGMAYTKLTGSNNNFYQLDFEYRQYKSLGNRKVIAWTAQSRNGFGNIPLNQYNLLGTPWDLRGYYMGQYRDKSVHVALAEYRQMINTSGATKIKKLINHIGFAAWTGTGFMGPTPGKIEGVLPNVGAGLRIELQPRMNIRFDVGRDFKNNSTLFYMNMTEAF